MSGCVEASNKLSLQALTRFGELVEAQNRSWRKLRGRVAVDFEDGCDSLFFRLTGTTDSPALLAVAAAREFEQVNHARRQVILAVRHLAAETGIALEMSSSGVWPTQWGAATSTLQVGPNLTRLAMQFSHVDLLLRLLENQWLPRIDSTRAAILIEHKAPPANEAKWKREDEAESFFGPGILSIDCSVVDDPEFQPTSSEELVAQLAPHRNSPGQLVLNKVVERVGRNRFSFDLLGKGKADISFSDKLDDFQIIPQGKRMGRLVETLGVPGAVDKLVQEFQALDKARSTALALVQRAMAEHGFVLDEDGWYFGKTHREFQFPSGRSLTLKVRNKPPHQIIHDWLKQHRPFEPIPDSSHLAQQSSEEHVLAERKTLPLRPLANESKRLPDLGAFDIARIDQCADATISEFKRTVETLPVYGRVFDQHHPLWFWTQPLWYSRGTDNWADENWWLELASKHWELGQVQIAALVMMVNGRQEPRAEILRVLNEHEAWDSEALEDTLLWYLVDDLPWPIDKYEGYPVFPRVLGSPPPPLARCAAMHCRERLKSASSSATDQNKREILMRTFEEAAKLDLVSAREWLSDEELAALHRACVEWAAQDDLTSLRQDSPLTVAAHFGWPDLVRTLEANPLFIAAQFEYDLISFDPGMLSLKLSRIRPCELGARFAAYAMSLDFSPIVEQQVETFSGTVDQSIRDAFRTGLLNSRRLDLLAAAIAWKRWRLFRPDNKGGLLR